MSEKKAARTALEEMPPFRQTPLTFDDYKSAVVAAIKSRFNEKRIWIKGYDYSVSPLRFPEPTTRAANEFSRHYLRIVSRHIQQNILPYDASERSSMDEELERFLGDADWRDKHIQMYLREMVALAVERNGHLGPRSIEFATAAIKGELPSTRDRRKENYQRDKTIVRLMKILVDDIGLYVWSESGPNIYAADILSEAFKELQLDYILEAEAIAKIWYKKRKQFT